MSRMPPKPTTRPNRKSSQAYPILLTFLSSVRRETSIEIQGNFTYTACNDPNTVCTRMSQTYLYLQIAESIRREILEGKLKPGDRLPSVRQLRTVWNCTPGTVQRAYTELCRQGLLVSRSGKGTQVADDSPPIRTQATDSLRRASLIHRTEAFLLESLTSGYSIPDIYQALDLAMDRWRAIGSLPKAAPGSILRFAGSHDMVINALARGIGEIIPGAALQINFCGSLGGLIALAEGKAEIAGCHLLDAESNSYNLPFIQRVLPGKETLLIRLAHRRLGMITAPGNPHGLRGLADLAEANLRFVNRQSGSGTRVWLDNEFKRLQIDSRSIPGYSDERLTHSDVARAVAEGEADCGLGLEASAFAYGLGFILLANECYDLALLASTAEQPTVKALLDWLMSAEAKAFVATFRGYENSETGAVQLT